MGVSVDDDNVTFTTGSNVLDELLGAISARCMLLIVGHPGAGKTTLASQICYHNTLRGHKCLYITFYEDKEKLYRNMRRLGINLQEAEVRKLLDFVKLPVVSFEESLIAISQLIAKESYGVVVIDSLNPIMDLIEKKEAQRAILLNFFYQLINVFNGVLIAVAEIALGKETLDLGAIEFVADTVIYLKHRIEHGSISRILELRKVRGAPLKTAEMSFSISEGKGIVLHVIPRLERIIDASSEHLRSTLSSTGYMMGHLQSGDIIVISVPPCVKDLLPMIPILDVAITNNMKTLIVSFKHSPNEIKHMISRTMSNFLGVDDAQIYMYLEKHVHVTSLNPTIMSIPQLFTDILDIIIKLKPDFVIFIDLESLAPLVVNLRTYWVTFMNTVLWIKNIGKATVCIISRYDPKWVEMHESIADIVIRYYYRRENNELKSTIYISQAGEKPRIYEVSPSTFKEISTQIEQLVKLIKERLNHTSGGIH